MNQLKKISIAGLFFLAAIMSCKKDANSLNSEQSENIPSSKNTAKVKWTDFMNDGFDAGWTQDVVGGGSWWLQTTTGIEWAIINNPDPAQKGRAEVSRPLCYYNNTNKTVIVKGKFKMETTADNGKTNNGGWILQTMAWSFKDPSGTTQYKPLVVARMDGNGLAYLVYDYVWDASNHPVVKSGYPIVKTIQSGSMAGQTVELALHITFANNSTGKVQANLNGSFVTAAEYNGLTYPAIFPSSNQQIQWKGGCYSAWEGIWYAKIGVYYLYTDQAQ